MLNIAMVLLLLVVIGMLALVLVRLAGRRPDREYSSPPSIEPSSALVPTGSVPASAALVDVVRSVDGGFHVVERSSGVMVLEMSAIAMRTPDRRATIPKAVAPNAALLGGLSGIGIDVASALTAGTEYVVRFTPEIQKLLDSGAAKLMQTARGAVSDAVSTTSGQVLEHGTLVEQFAQSPAQLLAGGLTAGAAAAQLYQIHAALERIERRLDELVGRVRDDDHGELTAAEALVAPVLAAAINGRVPPQLAAELAVHRQRVDSIYYSRQRFVERFRDELESRQARHAAKKDEPRAWARGASKAFGDRETFEAEVLIYARAMSIQARLAMCTAAVVALDGQPEVAQWMLRDVAENTADAFGDLARRLGALAQEDIGWTWVPLSGRKELQETSKTLAELFETQVAPQLPARPSDTVEFNLQLGPGSS